KTARNCRSRNSSKLPNRSASNAAINQIAARTVALIPRPMAEKPKWHFDEIRDPRVLAAMEKVPRHLFVPEEQRERAYQDIALSIGRGQTISQPFIVAFMTENLHPKPTDKILEIGCGSGYQAAIL